MAPFCIGPVHISLRSCSAVGARQAPENRFPTLFTESIILKQTPVCTFERITRCFSCQDAKKRNEEAALCFERFAFYEKPPGGGLTLVCRVYRAGIPSTLRFLQQ